MTTTANPPPGAVPATGADDPFTASSNSTLRYASLDADQVSYYAHSSPSQARHALEAHLKDTDRRIQDASRLGTTLLQQRKDLSARLEDVKHVQEDSEVPAELRKKLSELEKEYNDIGKESARALLPKTRVTSIGGDVSGTPSAYTGSGRESPTKVTAPSRRQRNQQTSRVHDIEFATEISTSLLAQVRQLQTALAEKDESLKETTSAKAQLEADLVSMSQKNKQMDEHEQRYKDENWNLETRLQELEQSFRESSDKEQRLAQTLKSTQSDKAAAQRDLDELKVSHDRLTEDHANIKRQQETDLHGLRRDATLHESDMQRMQKRIEELTAQNTELARAVSYRWNQPGTATDTDFVSADEEHHGSDGTPDNSEPASPVKGTPRHGMLESETLKSSLTHAHRMIQNLKNNIHREKTEKIELKRMLQDARDELETRRSDGGIGANMARKRRSDTDIAKLRRPARSAALGVGRNGTTEILEDDEWEELDGQKTPSKSRHVSAIYTGAAAGATAAAAHDYADNETTDAFETATEREGTSTDAFETGRESLGEEDSDDLTETEGVNRNNTIRKGPASLANARPGDRRSFQSTASTSADEDEDEEDEIRTPLPTQQSRFKVRMNRSSRRLRVDEMIDESPHRHSPASSIGTPGPAGQSLGDELDALDDDSNHGTPSGLSESRSGTPLTQRLRSVGPPSPTPSDTKSSVETPDTLQKLAMGTPAININPSESHNLSDDLAHEANVAMLAHEAVTNKPSYTDAGVMTEPWESEQDSKQGLRDKAAEVVGGALAGFGLGRLGRGKGNDTDDARQQDEGVQAIPDTGKLDVSAGAVPSSADAQSHLKPVEAPLLERSKIFSQETSPVFPKIPAPVKTPFQSTRILALETTPIYLTNSDRVLHAKQILLASEKPYQKSATISQETTPITPPTPHRTQHVSHAVGTDEDLPTQQKHDAEGKESPLAAAPAAATAASPPSQIKPVPQPLDFSSFVVQDLEPKALPEAKSPMTPLLPVRSPKRSTLENPIPGTDGARPGAAFVASPVSQRYDKNGSADYERLHNDLAEGDDLLAGNTELSTYRKSPEEVTPHLTTYSDAPDNTIPATRHLQMKRAVMDEGSQTLISGTEVDNLIKNKTKISIVVGPSAEQTTRPSTAIGPSSRRSIDGFVTAGEASPIRTPRRPASSGSMRSRPNDAPPPLPVDKNQKIAAAAQKVPVAPALSGVGSMGPPTMPASAYKQNRPGTPHSRTYSRDGTTPRPGRLSRGPQSPGAMSRRTSVSSFASELDERFNIHNGQFMYPADVKPSTDPRMIQAITQTMIGEYLWKYTRKAGRSTTSKTRHRRFFWVHPYTRTLYWSEKDPSAAGRDMLKAKSVAIEAVRVITDNNTSPPGLHRKSIVIVTPGRDVLFTAPTGQRHETWFNALSYLLLRTELEKEEAQDTVDMDDLEEFNPALGSSVRHSINRLTGRSQSRMSLSSYNSRTTRNGSPQRAVYETPTLNHKTSKAASRHVDVSTNSPTGATGARDGAVSAASGRMSSITSKFRPTSSHRGSMSTRRGRASFGARSRPGDPSDIYDASVVDESAEDLRAVIARQEADADRLENVRACCDGKHDVGSLSRGNKHTSLSSRLSGGHTHSHGHP